MYIFQYNKEREEILNLLRPYMEAQILIPYIGAGFSKGTRTRHGGCIPSGWALKEKMLEMLQDVAGYSGDEVNIYRNEKLNDMADSFFFELEKNDELHSVFRKYMKSNFSQTIDYPSDKREFLDSGWPAIYTLNYDDVIESYLAQYYAIHAYEKQSKRTTKNERCIFKIHGDIQKYLSTGDLKYLVLGRKQYIRILRDTDNNDMITTMQNDFYSKSIMFVGCSLTNEMDLLYTAELQIAEKIKNNDDHAVIYIRYIEDGKNYDISRLDMNQFEQYGITHIINIDKDGIHDFYHSLYDISSRLKEGNVSDSIEIFSGYKFKENTEMDARKQYDLDCLRGREVLNIKSKEIKLPSFFISRTSVENQVINILKNDSVNENRKSIYFLTGQKVSGRTFALFDILQHFLIRKIFYFPTGTLISDNALLKMINYREAYFLFDENVLDRDQLIEKILDNIDAIKTNKNTMIIVVNRSDGKFFRYYSTHLVQSEADFKIINLSNALQNEEIGEFNKNIRHLSLIDYKEKDTILDYLYQFWSIDLSSDGYDFHNAPHLPEINFLSRTNVAEIKAMIVLATELRISSRTAIELQIDEPMYRLMERFGQYIQKYYVLRSVEDDKWSGFKFVLNSSSWAICVLSSFASDKSNYEAIAKAYWSILSYYKKYYKEGKFLQRIVRKYCFLDDIQTLFYNQRFKGSLQLPYQIYKKIHAFMSDDYQFLHQAAKCKLQIAKKTSLRKEEKAFYLEEAYLNIIRAYDLAKDKSYRNINYTRLHMSLTEALIVTNYIFNKVNRKGEALNFQKQEERAIDAYYRTFCEFGDIDNQFDKKEIQDVEQFIKYMLKSKNISGEYRNRLAEFLNVFRNMNQ